MNMTQIIAFVGFRQVGKSTAAKYLEDKYAFVRHNFKDALVDEIIEKFPDLLDAIYLVYKDQHTEGGGYISWLFQTKPPLMRALMQNYGTEVRRGDYKGYWTTKWGVNLPQGNPVVCDDCRFIDESKKVREKDGTIIRLTRPDITSGGDHTSETEQNEIVADYTIELEPGSHDKLYTELDKIVG